MAVDAGGGVSSPAMPTAQLSDDAITLLKAFVTLQDRDEVATVQAAAIQGRLSYMDAYRLVNELFTAGYLEHDLEVTAEGRKAAS